MNLICLEHICRYYLLFQSIHLSLKIDPILENSSRFGNTRKQYHCVLHQDIHWNEEYIWYNAWFLYIQWYQIWIFKIVYSFTSNMEESLFHILDTFPIGFHCTTNETHHHLFWEIVRLLYERHQSSFPNIFLVEKYHSR